MNRRRLAGVAAVALGMILTGTLTFSQSRPPTQGRLSGGTAVVSAGIISRPRWTNGRRAGWACHHPRRWRWSGGRGAALAACTDDITKYCTGQTGWGAGVPRAAFGHAVGRVQDRACCASRPGDHGHSGMQSLAPLRQSAWPLAPVTGPAAVETNVGYTFAYPYVLPPGPGGVPSVALDSKATFGPFSAPPQENHSSSSSTRVTS